MKRFRPDSLIVSVLIAGLVLLLALHFGTAHAAGTDENNSQKVVFFYCDS